MHIEKKKEEENGTEKRGISSIEPYEKKDILR